MAMPDHEPKYEIELSDEASASFVQAIDHVVRSSAPLRQRIEQIGDSIVAISAQLAPHIAKSLEYVETFYRQHADSIAQFADKLARLPDEMRGALVLLAQKGWFVAADYFTMAELHQLAAALRHPPEDESMLVQHYRARLPEIAHELATKFPRRASILEDAFSAHGRGDYNLSVPVFLAQADGICTEIVGRKLYGKSNGRPHLYKHIEQLPKDWISSIILFPLTQTLPIAASLSEREPDFRGLNRHMVLHGESLDYGTEVNSLKAASWLYYVATMLRPDAANESPAS